MAKRKDDTGMQSIKRWAGSVAENLVQDPSGYCLLRLPRTSVSMFVGFPDLVPRADLQDSKRVGGHHVGPTVQLQVRGPHRINPTEPHALRTYGAHLLPPLFPLPPARTLLPFSLFLISQCRSEGRQFVRVGLYDHGPVQQRVCGTCGT